MPKIALLNIKGEKIKDIKLNDEVFGIEPNNQTIYDAVVLKNASMRQGTHSTKTRSEVSGGGRKPWRQKGTGNARQGSIRAPHFVGGGVVFGPTTNRNYTKKQNRKERRLALKSALTHKANAKEIIVVESLNENIVLATRNLPNVILLEASEINTYDVISSDVMVVTSEAIKQIEEVLV